MSLRSKWAAGKARGGRISKAIGNRSGGRRTAAGPFSTQPSGPRPVGCFSVRRPPDSLDPYQFRYGRFAPALKKKPTDPAPAGRRHYYMRDGALGGYTL